MTRLAVRLGALALLAFVMGCGEAAPPQGADQPAPPKADAPHTQAPEAAAPEINAAYWINSGPLTLAGLRGKIVLLEFWATWCPPCLTTIPHLIEMHKDHASQGLVIVSLTNEPKEKVEPFVKQMGMTYAIGGGSTSGKDYNVRGIPHALLINPAGNVVWTGHPLASELHEALHTQLEGKAK